MRVITSLFSDAREGTDKSEGVPPRAVGCIWAVCYNVGNGEQAEYITFRHKAEKRRKKNESKKSERRNNRSKRG